MKSRSMVEWSTSDSGPSRRSSRNSGIQRRVWRHLLRANPDEHDPLRTREESPSFPGRQQSGQRIRLPKANSMKSASDSAKSDVSSMSCKTMLSQQTGTVSQKGLSSDGKRSHKKFAADLVQSSKKPCHSCTSDPVEESPVSAAVLTIPSNSGVSYKFTENGLVHHDHEPSPDLSFLSYR